MAGTQRRSATATRFRQIIARRREACHICGKPIDYTLPRTDPKSFVIDHVIPLAKGGEDALSNVKAAHRHRNLQQQEARTHHRPPRPTKRLPQLTADANPCTPGEGTPQSCRQYLRG